MNKSSSTYDVVIVGASFAGLVCARTAAMRGLKAIVIERKEEPGARVATTGILVKEAVDELDLPVQLTHKVRGVRLYSPRLQSIDLKAPGYYFLSTDTPNLLRWLADEAQRAGARVACGVRFKGASRDGGYLSLKDHRIKTRYLVGADGAKSRVAEEFGLGRNSRFLVGLEAEYDGLNIAGDVLHCFIDKKLAPGYLGWAVPGVGVTQIGLAVSEHEKPDLKAFEQKISALLGLTQGRVAARRSGLIPAGGLVRPFSAQQVLLVGDAAGLVSPLTGGGIRLAFHYGRRAGQAIADYLLDGGGEPGAVMAREYPHFALKGIMRTLMNFAPPNWMIDHLLFTAPVRALAQELYFHRRNVPGEPWHEPGTTPQARLNPKTRTLSFLSV
ncbi:MAG: NAD(P)/FAD-dependent oxidoreductase [Alphaproteobacteria bacterium]